MKQYVVFTVHRMTDQLKRIFRHCQKQSQNTSIYKTNFDEVKCRLSAINWPYILSSEGNIDHQVEMFYTVKNNIISKTVPTRRRKRTHHSKLPVWFNPNLKNLRNRKQKAHKIYKKEDSPNNLENYLTICNELNRAIATAHEEYNRKVGAEVKSCPKRFFNYAKT